MIVFSSAKLEHKLSSHELTSWDKAKYIVFMVVINSLAGPIYVLTPSYGAKEPLWNSILSLFAGMLTIIITYNGIKKCYSLNKDIDDIDFVGRFVALYTPMTVKFLIIGVVILGVSYFIIQSLADNSEDSRNAFAYWLNLEGPIFTYLFYRFLQRSFTRLGQLVKINV